MTALISPQDALVYVMVTAAAADRTVHSIESEVISGIVETLPVFAKYERTHLASAISACKELLSSEEGLDAILGLVAGALPHGLRDTAYALAVEVAASDRKVIQEELVFLELLADRLDVPKLSIAAIEYSARVRYRQK